MVAAIFLGCAVAAGPAVAGADRLTRDDLRRLRPLVVQGRVPLGGQAVQVDAAHVPSVVTGSRW